VPSRKKISRFAISIAAQMVCAKQFVARAIHPGTHAFHQNGEASLALLR